MSTYYQEGSIHLPDKREKSNDQGSREYCPRCKCYNNESVSIPISMFPNQCWSRPHEVNGLGDYGSGRGRCCKWMRLLQPLVRAER